MDCDMAFGASLDKINPSSSKYFLTLKLKLIPLPCSFQHKNTNIKNPNQYFSIVLQIVSKSREEIFIGWIWLGIIYGMGSQRFFIHNFIASKSKGPHHIKSNSSQSRTHPLPCLAVFFTVANMNIGFSRILLDFIILNKFFLISSSSSLDFCELNLWPSQGCGLILPGAI